MESLPQINSYRLANCSRRVVSSSVPIPSTVGVTLSESLSRRRSGRADRTAESTTTIPTPFVVSKSLKLWKSLPRLLVV